MIENKDKKDFGCIINSMYDSIDNVCDAYCENDNERALKWINIVYKHIQEIEQIIKYNNNESGDIIKQNIF